MKKYIIGVLSLYLCIALWVATGLYSSPKNKEVFSFNLGAGIVWPITIFKD